MNRKFKVAAVQAVPEWLDLQAGVEKTIRLIGEAAQQGCRLVAFPEAWLPGYPYYIWMGAPAWGMQFSGRYFDNSLEVDGEEMEEICAAARDNQVSVVLGYSERSGGSLYLGQAIIDETGSIISARRKLKPTHVERSVFGEGSGSDLRVENLPVGRVGALCCWEHIQPLSKFALYSQHEEIHVASWPVFSVDESMVYALSAEANLAVTRTYALEGQCFVIASFSVMSDAILAQLNDDGHALPFFGAGGGYATIFGPDGRQLAPFLAPDEEGLVIAEIDLDMIKYVKMFADPVGHYAKPDATQLLLHRGEAKPVIEESHPAVERSALGRSSEVVGEEELEQ